MMDDDDDDDDDGDDDDDDDDDDVASFWSQCKFCPNFCKFRSRKK